MEPRGPHRPPHNPVGTAAVARSGGKPASWSPCWASGLIVGGGGGGGATGAGGRGEGGEAQSEPRKFVLRLAFTRLFNLLPRVTGQAAAPLRQCPFPETASWEGGRKYFPETQQRGSALDTWLEGAPRTRAFTQHCWGQEIALALVAVLLSVRVAALGPQRAPQKQSLGTSQPPVVATSLAGI